MAEQQLPEEVKRRIVVELARFRRPREVRKILVEEYDVDFDEKFIIRYDATKDYCCTGAALQELFHKTRDDFVKGMNDLHISHSAYRLRRLQRLSERAEEQGNLKLAASLLRQAAEDYGGVFTNTRNIVGNVSHEHFSADEARSKLASLKQRQAEKQADTKH